MCWVICWINIFLDFIISTIRVVLPRINSKSQVVKLKLIELIKKEKGGGDDGGGDQKNKRK